MKTNPMPTFIQRAAVLLLLSTFNLQLPAHAQGTAFTYQGRLNDGANPANGTYDLRFQLNDAATGGNQWGQPLTNSAVAVSNGLFTTTLDFGFGVLTGGPRWLQVALRTNGGGGFVFLAPRTALLPAPYAVYSANAAQAGTISGTVPASGLNGLYSNPVNFNNPASSFAGDGTGLLNVNAATLNGISSAGFWTTNGNAGANPANGAFLGTTDNLPLEFKVNGTRALRLEPTANTDTVNVVGGSAHNFVGAGVVGATIGGGGGSHISFTSSTNSVEADFGTVSGGAGNTIQFASEWATIGGGVLNTIQLGADSSTIGGGYLNTIQPTAFNATIGGGARNEIQFSAEAATIGGGYKNTIETNADYATIAGGFANKILTNAARATIGGGDQNTTGGNYATVPGGVGNTAGGQFSFAAGHDAKALHDGTFVWADHVPGFNAYASTGTNQFCIRARGGIQVEPLTSMYFGNSVRQMLNLFGNFYGIGVQAFTMYFRTDGNNGGFSWFKGGVHNDSQNNPGAGGTELMRLDTGGNLKTLTGTIASLSDRNAKTAFQSVDAQAVLAQVAALPISTWRYKNAEASQRHLGPMAQDFYSAFGIGLDDKSICTVDEGGVALAAIQGLNQKVEAGGRKSEDRMQKLESENAELKQRLAALEKIIRSQKSN
jgi:hypothetical protein